MTGNAVFFPLDMYVEKFVLQQIRVNKVRRTLFSKMSR